MKTNKEILENLFQTRQIDLRHGSIFSESLTPMPDNFDFDRIEGMILGLAIGDALGFSTETMLPQRRRKRYGQIEDYIQGEAKISDDTLLAIWTLEQIIEDGNFQPENVAQKFCSNAIPGMGRTVAAFRQNFRSGKLAWYKCGPKSAGNGALMRIAPMVIPHLKTGGIDLWVDTALSAMITHNDSGSTAACLAFINMIWQLLKMNKAPKAKWWLETYVNTAKELESDASYRPRGGNYTKYNGYIWSFVKKRVPEARGKKLTIIEACNSWYSGAYLLETVPSVIYILMEYGGNPREAIIRAVNDTKDNDTIAAIVGGIVGALHGKKKLPEKWISGLTDENDAITQVLKKAQEIFN